MSTTQFKTENKSNSPEEMETYSVKQKAESGITNPYVSGAEGRKEWNDRLDNMKNNIRLWQKMSAGLLVAVIILIICFCLIAMKSKNIPFAVEMNNGIPVAIKTMSETSLDQQKLIQLEIENFIRNSRSISSDTAAQKRMLDEVYAYSDGSTINYLHDYYAKNNPFVLAAQYTISVEDVTTLPLSKNTFQVMWEETKRDITNGNVMGTTKWVANITYAFGPVNPKFMQDNPFGLYFTQISWSQSQIQ